MQSGETDGVSHPSHRSPCLPGEWRDRPAPVQRSCAMPRVRSRLWRFLLSLTLLGGLLLTPSAVSADGLVRFSEHAVNLFCDAAGPEGELHLFAGASSEFGEFADFVAWQAPVVPGSPPDLSGSTNE